MVEILEFFLTINKSTYKRKGKRATDKLYLGILEKDTKKVLKAIFYRYADYVDTYKGTLKNIKQEAEGLTPRQFAAKSSSRGIIEIIIFAGANILCTGR